MKVKRWLLYFGFSILALLGLVLVYFSLAYILARIPVGNYNSTTKDVIIYIKTNGIHTDIVVPIKNSQKDWSKEIKFSNTTSNDTGFTYLGMGWGDKGFYLETPTWADLKASVAFKAVFGLGNTAIHATFYHKIVEDETCKKIEISTEQYNQLVKYISNSFSTDLSEHWININTNANYGNDDAFYEAKGSYSMFYTCNTWSNNALKACGQKAALWTPFDTGIFLHYK